MHIGTARMIIRHCREILQNEKSTRQEIFKASALALQAMSYQDARQGMRLKIKSAKYMKKYTKEQAKQKLSELATKAEELIGKSIQ